MTSQCAEAVIQEEIQRANKLIETPSSEPFGSSVAHVKHSGNLNAADEKRLKELEREIFDLQITNRGKDYLIKELNQERKSFFDHCWLRIGQWANWKQRCNSWLGIN